MQLFNSRKFDKMSVLKLYLRKTLTNMSEIWNGTNYVKAEVEI